MRSRRWWSALSVVAVAGMAVATPAVAQPATPEDAGALQIVDERGRPLTSGGSTTRFTLELAADEAFCPGDSANDNYRVNSFMVPAHLPATQVSYDGLGPKPQHYRSYDGFVMPLYDQFTSDYTSALTAEQDRPGGPGPIVDVPILSFGVYDDGELPTGRYRVGLACTLLNEVRKYWDTEIVVTADADDEPAGIAWRLAGAAAPSDAGSGPSPLVLAAVAVVAAALVAGARFRRRPSATSSKESR